MSWLKNGRFSINLELLEGLKVKECYDLYPKITKEIVKEAWEKANPKKKK
jgi:uncharacterized protein (DUF433 family)